MNAHTYTPRADEIEASAEALAALWPERAATATRERHRVPILDLHAEGKRYWSVRVQAPAAFDAPRPGQYITLGLHDVEPRYLVVARAASGAWEFLIDRASTLGRSLEHHVAGAHAILSAPEGPGWDLEALAGAPTVLAFATGSGTATLMPALDHLAAHAPERLASVVVYQGESDADAFAFTPALEALIARGLTLRRTFSNRPDGDTGPRFVQHALDADARDLDGAVALLAGAPVMIRHVCAHLMRAGVPFDDIHTNMRD